MRPASAGPSGAAKLTPLSAGHLGIAIRRHEKVTRRFIRIIKNLFWTERNWLPAAGPLRALPVVPVGTASHVTDFPHDLIIRSIPFHGVPSSSSYSSSLSSVDDS
jgi:hypothetical protein